MHHVMLVDDEQLIRITLKSLIDWENSGFQLACEAANGRQAIELLAAHPEVGIIITDLKMPHMDGLDLIRYVREQRLPCQIAVLSSYGDYAFVREAFRLGISDYILKYDLEKDSIMQLLRQMGTKDQHHVLALDQPDSLKAPLPKRMALDFLLRGEVDRVPPNVLAIHPAAIVSFFVMVDDYDAIDFANHEQAANFSEVMINSIRETAGVICCEAVAVSPQAYIAILSFQRRDEMAIRPQLDSFLQRLRWLFKRYADVLLTVGISATGSGLESVKSLSKEAEGNADYRYIFGKNRNIFPEDTQHLKLAVQTLGDREVDFSLLFDAMTRLDIEEAEAALHLIFAEFERIYRADFKHMHAAYLDLFYRILTYIGKLDTGTNQSTNFYEILASFVTKGEVESWIANFMKNIMLYRQSKQPSHSPLIDRVLKFIEQNYQEKISLEMVCRYLEISESHFSALFSKEMSQTFTEYLIQLRIEKAKHLLRHTNDKIYMISEAVGYANVEHFSRIFKKVAGVGPHQYRNRAH